MSIVINPSKARKAREKRNLLLSETDWWGLSDYSMTAAQTTYRQALRDVPEQELFPELITWPEEPTS